MKKKIIKKKNLEKNIAKTHIKELFEEASKVFKECPDLADEYVKKARKIQMKFQLKMPMEYKRRFCSKCFSYILPPFNCRIRLNKGKIVYLCLKCKNHMRIPFKKD